MIVLHPRTFDIPASPYFRVYCDGVLVRGLYEAGPSVTSAALADGTHVFAVVAVDAAGNVSPMGAALAVTIDTAAPVVQSAGRGGDL